VIKAGEQSSVLTVSGGGTQPNQINNMDFVLRYTQKLQALYKN
jgi:hypothetical protein